MGIPKFFRWLSERYPLINQTITPEHPGPQFDNFYLDMNGIIHNCTHPEYAVKDPITGLQKNIPEEEMAVGVIQYVDKLFHMVQPKKVFFLAVDGVAPRAKCNQQRARRFRAAKDRADALAKVEREKGIVLKPEDRPWDSNAITPGTPFMVRLSAHIKFFIQKKMQEDAAWAACEQIIFSGHDIPGEGEHKIIDFIRHEKAQPDYPVNVSHVIHGLDADLIMLSLITHEPNFSLLREDVLTRTSNKGAPTDFHLLHLAAVREYLECEMRPSYESSVEKRESSSTAIDDWDLERFINDFVLLCFFIGNDFLPSLPAQDIAEGGLNAMIEMYRDALPDMGGFLTGNDALRSINYQRLEVFLTHLSRYEAEAMDPNFSEAYGRLDELGPSIDNDSFGGFFGTDEGEDEDTRGDKKDGASAPALSGEEDRLARDLASIGVKLADFDVSSEAGTPKSGKSTTSAPIPLMTEEDSSVHWKNRYYRTKFGDEHLPKNDPDFHEKLRMHYIEGITWCWLYYQHGVQSWGWFFPFHYAPLACDLRPTRLSNVDQLAAGRIGDEQFDFDMGEAFGPFEQLLAVLPPASAHCLPEPHSALMLNPESEIADFYPETFELDMNGKKNDWEAVVLLPFIDAKRLRAAAEPCLKVCSADVRARNERGTPCVFKRLRVIKHDDGRLEVPKLRHVSSTMPDRFPDLEHCAVSLEDFHLRPYPGGQSPGFSLLPGAPWREHSMPGFPSLHFVDFVTEDKQIGVNVFGNPSRQSTLVIRPKPPTERIPSKQLLGQTVWVGYPYFTPGLCVRISSPDGMTFVGNDGAFVHMDWTADNQLEYDAYIRELKLASNKLLKGRGVNCTDDHTILQVRRCVGVREDFDGRHLREFQNHTHTYPLSVVSPFGPNQLWRQDARYLESEESAEARFPVGQRCVYIGTQRTDVFGCLATVTDSSDSNLVVQLEVPPKLETVGRVAFVQHAQQNWVPIFQVAKRVGVSTRVLGMITADTLVNVGKKSKVNLGLQLKYKRGEFALGYAREVEREDRRTVPPTKQLVWELSESLAIPLIELYVQELPHVVAALEKNSKNYVTDEDILDSYEEMFGPFEKVLASPMVHVRVLDRDEFEAKEHPPQQESEELSLPRRVVKECEDWLKDLGVPFAMAEGGSHALQRDQVQAIEVASAVRHARFMKALRGKTVRLPPLAAGELKPGRYSFENVSPSVLMRPVSKLPVVFSQALRRVQLGDYVMIITNSHAVPFGSCGTIIRIDSRGLRQDDDVKPGPASDSGHNQGIASVSILLDAEHLGATTLGGSCSNLRGTTAPANSIFNLSAGAELLGTNAVAEVPVPRRASRGARREAATPGPRSRLVARDGGFSSSGHVPASAPSSVQGTKHSVHEREREMAGQHPKARTILSSSPPAALTQTELAGARKKSAQSSSDLVRFVSAAASQTADVPTAAVSSPETSFRKPVGTGADGSVGSALVTTARQPPAVSDPPKALKPKATKSSAAPEPEPEKAAQPRITKPNPRASTASAAHDHKTRSRRKSGFDASAFYTSLHPEAGTTATTEADLPPELQSLLATIASGDLDSITAPSIPANSASAQPMPASSNKTKSNQRSRSPSGKKAKKQTATSAPGGKSARPQRPPAPKSIQARPKPKPTTE